MAHPEAERKIIPTALELFAGAGGLAMGLSLAGFRHVGVVEWNRWACDTVRANQRRGHPLVADWPLHEGDVRSFDFSAIAEPVDLVAAGPPCQPFSICGKHRAFLDDRDMFPATIAVIRRLRPRAFIVENVKGLLRAPFADYFQYVTLCLAFPELAQAGAEGWREHLDRLRRHERAGRRSGLTYQVKYQLLNAANYGVAQKRERVFIVGFRADGPADWRFPPPSHSPEALWREQFETGAYWDRHGLPRPARGSGERKRREAFGSDGRRAWRTVRDALAGLPDPERDAGAARAIPDHRFQPGVRFYPGHTGSPLDLPAKTLKAGDHGVPGGENALVRPDGSGRYFTVRESARLQCFPDSYVLNGSWSEAMRQLGNAVPVTLAHAVGASVARALETPRREDGDAALPSPRSPGIHAGHVSSRPPAAR